ncbi:MAG: alpha/beta hydrolase [Calditrichia bacterium]
MKKLLILGLLTFLFLIVMVFLKNWFVRKMTYPAPWTFVPSPPPGNLQELTLKVKNNLHVSGWYEDTVDSDFFLLYFHGNGENLAILGYSGLFEKLRQLNVNFLAIDYPGYGRSSGKPSETAIVQSGIAAVEWIANQYPDKRLVLCGWSLGAAAAIRTALQKPERISALIALSSWTSLPDVENHHYPTWLVRSLVDEDWNTLEAAPQITIPVLLIHGEQDRIIPSSHGQKLAQTFPNLLIWKLIPQAGHNDLLSYEEVWETIAQFLRKISIP